MKMTEAVHTRFDWRGSASTSESTEPHVKGLGLAWLGACCGKSSRILQPHTRTLMLGSTAQESGFKLQGKGQSRELPMTLTLSTL